MRGLTCLVVTGMKHQGVGEGAYCPTGEMPHCCSHSVDAPLHWYLHTSQRLLKAGGSHDVQHSSCPSEVQLTCVWMFLVVLTTPCSGSEQARLCAELNCLCF